MRFFPTLGEGALAGWPMVRTADSTLRPSRRNLRRRFSQSCAVPSFRLSLAGFESGPCDQLLARLFRAVSGKACEFSYSTFRHYAKFIACTPGRCDPATRSNVISSRHFRRRFGGVVWRAMKHNLLKEVISIINRYLCH